MQLRPILLVIGLLLTTLGFAMAVPVLVALAHEEQGWAPFGGAGAMTLFIGIGLWITNTGQKQTLTMQQAFILTTASWIALTAFAALPMWLGSAGLSYTDAFFEAMSGLTTTGSTVIEGLDKAPPSLLIWRALLQWLGGIGIIVMAIAVLPMLQVGGLQLFRLESSDTSEKIFARATQIAGYIALVYFIISVACMLCYWATDKMTAFEAAAHAMTTIATGGYSTSDKSVGSFDSPAVDAIATIFMLAGSLPFVLYLNAIRGKTHMFLIDPQVRWFMGIVITLISIMTVHLVVGQFYDPLNALRYASFNIVSIMTGTGYATTDYGQWGTFALTVFFFTMFIGGCAGSTSCGIKIFRFIVLHALVDSQIKKIMHPHGVFVPKYGREALSSDVIASVVSFIFLFFILFGVFAFALSLMGLDTITSFSAAGTALANVGPGLGETVGPAGSFKYLPDLAKWLLSLAMLLGRLELFTVLVLFTPAFWRG